MVHNGPGSVAAAAPDFPSDDLPNMDSMDIQQLVEFLQSLFQAAEFQKAESVLMSLRAAIESNLSEDLTVKEVERIELLARIEGLEGDLGVLRNKCSDLELRLSESGERFRVEVAELEQQLKAENKRYSLLEAKLQNLDARKLGSDEEIEKYKENCERLEDENSRLKEACRVASEREKMTRENIAALLETQEDQGNVNSWRQKCKELEVKVSQLEDKNQPLIEEKKKLAKASIMPEMEVDCNAKDLPLTGKGKGKGKGKGNPALDEIIEIIDSDDELLPADCKVKENILEGALHVKNESVTDKSSKMLHSGTIRNHVVQEDDKMHRDGVLPIPTPKRKRITRIITSDSEDDEDNIPIGKLKLRALRRSKDVVEENDGPSDTAVDMVPSRKRLVLLRELYESDGSLKGRSPGNPLTPCSKGMNLRKKTICRNIGLSECDDYEEEEEVDRRKELDDASSSEGEGLGGFIVGESDSPESGANSENSSEVDSDVDLDSVLAGIRRQKNTKKWEFEADMLASFSKDPELCMKAVCALYRRQTSDEQSMKDTLLLNRRGFSKIDAQRGSLLAEFLTDGDPYGQLKKSVQDLEKYDPKGLDYCHKLATRYSKQLFSIYQNKEDPFFQPS